MAQDRSCSILFEHDYSFPTQRNSNIPSPQVHIDEPQAGFDIHLPPANTYPHQTSFIVPPLPLGVPVVQGRHKSPRTSQPCVKCRARKSKCNGLQPCQECAIHCTNCVYKDVSPPKALPPMVQVANSVSIVKSTLEELKLELRSWNDTTAALNQSINASSPPARTLSQIPHAVSSAEAPATSGWQTSHITPAHTLFDKWPSLKDLSSGVVFVDHLVANGHKVSDYPMVLEQNRGLLCFRGPGEGYDNDTLGPTSDPRRDNNGGIGLDRITDLRFSTVWELYNSYIETIHKLHPFMDENNLSTMIKAFSKETSLGDKGIASRATMADALAMGPGLKRKRYDGLERSLSNAIVLLVLALGKVCTHSEPLPALQEDRASHPNVSNDKLPGMDYYACAAEILGSEQGGNTLGHAQAMILAALYLDQFTCILESWSWINSACRACYVLIKANRKLTQSLGSTYSATLPLRERSRPNSIKWAYWTCVHLESKILAQMDSLPPSKITDLRSLVAYPDGVEDTVSFFFSKAPNLPCNTGSLRSVDDDIIKDLLHHATQQISVLDTWRRNLPRRVAWSDDDLPATEILLANLRAKYYGTIYSILRPCLEKAIHDYPWPSSQNYSEEDCRIIEIAVQCINAAIQSTIAFDRVGAASDGAYTEFDIFARTRRLIVTDIFGTFHAQFGNMLVLAAVFRSPLYKHLPPDTKLTRPVLVLIMERTCRMLEVVAPNSPIIQMDLELLQNVRRQLALYR